MARNFLVIDPEERPEVLRGLASPLRVRILKLLHGGIGVSVNDIADGLKLPQSTVSSNLQVLEEAGLIRAETQKGRKGNQKLCFSTFDEVLVMFREDIADASANVIEVAMPIGLYTSCEVSAPCGLCSTDGIIGLLDVPDFFLDPNRVNAALMWFTRGYIEYKFPNNAKLSRPGRRPNSNSRWSCPRRCREPSRTGPPTSRSRSTAPTSAPGPRPAISATSAASTRRTGGSSKGSQYGKLKTWRVDARGHLRRRRAHLGDDARATSTSPAIIRSACASASRARRPPRRRQHLRQGLRQLRPGHRHAADDRAVIVHWRLK